MPQPPTASRVLVRRAGRPMATDVSVQIAAPAEQELAAQAAADACMTWFDEVDARLSRFRPDSELSRLNQSTGRWFVASSVLFESVAVALRAATASNGLFDPTLLRHLEALGYDRDFALIARRETAPTAEVPPPIAPGAWRDIALDRRRRRIRLPQGVALDLGGIAKGWAADIALNRFCAPFPGALVNVGGDLRVRGGPEPGKPWSVGIRHPRDEAASLASEAATDPAAWAPVTVSPAQALYAAVVMFSRGGLATSGALRRWWWRDGRRAHHLLDPHTGRPVPLWIDGEGQDDGNGTGGAPMPVIATATALAPTAARAEVAAKVALLCGYPDALRAVEAAWERYGALGPETDADAGVALVLTFGSGDVALSSNLPEYLDTWGTDGAALPMLVGPGSGLPDAGKKGV